MKALRIGIDGYNMAMSRGTGIATYGYTLGKLLQTAGCSVEGVFGIDVGKNLDSREVAFFDNLEMDVSDNRWQRRWRALRTASRACLPQQLREVPITTAIDKRTYADRLPSFAKLWSGADLFRVAHRHFLMFNRLLSIKVADPPQIMHWTYPLPLKLHGARNIYTLHDLVPLRLPYATADHKRHYRRLIELCVAEGDRICTVSESSKADIISRFPASSGKISNTYQCSIIPDEILGSDIRQDAEMIEGIFDLRYRDYYLYFGAIDPKKNLGRVIEAFLGARSSSPLVIVGGRNWGTDSHLPGTGVNIHGHSVAERIKRLEYLPKALLFRLIRGAKAILFPSLFEGFGLPVLEALELGTPVITSNISSLPEIVGEAGMLVDPYSVPDIIGAISALDANPGLGEEMSKKGLAQAKKFTAEIYLERLERMYSETIRAVR